MQGTLKGTREIENLNKPCLRVQRAKNQERRTKIQNLKSTGFPPALLRGGKMRWIVDTIELPQDQPPSVAGPRVELIPGDRAVAHVLLRVAVNSQQFLLAQTFQQPSKGEHHNRVAHHQHRLFAAIARQGPKKAVHSKCDVRIAFAARRTVIVLAFTLPPLPFVRILLLTTSWSSSWW